MEEGKKRCAGCTGHILPLCWCTCLLFILRSELKASGRWERGHSSSTLRGILCSPALPHERHFCPAVKYIAPHLSWCGLPSFFLSFFFENSLCPEAKLRFISCWKKTCEDDWAPYKPLVYIILQRFQIYVHFMWKTQLHNGALNRGIFLDRTIWMTSPCAMEAILIFCSGSELQNCFRFWISRWCVISGSYGIMLPLNRTAY